MKKPTIITGVFLPVAALCTLLCSPSASLAQAIIPPPAPPPGYSSSGNPSYTEVTESDREGGKDFYFIYQWWDDISQTKHNVTLPRGDGVIGTHDLTFKMEDSHAWGFGVGYSFSERLNLNFDFTFAEPDYTATFGNLELRGEAWTHTGDMSLDFHLLKRPFTPYVSLSIGYFYIDTGIPSGPPEYMIWWDYYWGYVGTVTQDTFSETYFTASAEAGLRWDVADGFFFKLGVSSYWMDTHIGGVENLHTNLSVGWRY